jgi:hypothetical protein
MKKFILVIGISFSLAACSKNKTCYRCQCISGTRTYDEKVCTDGDPKKKLPETDSQGRLGWQCTEQ